MIYGNSTRNRWICTAAALHPAMASTTGDTAGLSRVDAVAFHMEDELSPALLPRHGTPRGHGGRPHVRQRVEGGAPVVGGSQREPLSGPVAHEEERSQIRIRSRSPFQRTLNPKPDVGRCEIGVAHHGLQRIRIRARSRTERDRDQLAFEILCGVGNAVQAL